MARSRKSRNTDQKANGIPEQGLPSPALPRGKCGAQGRIRSAGSTQGKDGSDQHVVQFRNSARPVVPEDAHKQEQRTMAKFIHSPVLSEREKASSFLLIETLTFYCELFFCAVAFPLTQELPPFKNHKLVLSFPFISTPKIPQSSRSQQSHS